MLDSPLLFALISLLGGAIAAVSGFGIGSLLTPFLMLSFPTAEAVAIVAIPHAVATVTRWYRLRREIHWPTFRQFGVAIACGGLLGAALQPFAGSSLLGFVLAGLLIAAGSAELAGRPLPLPATAFWRLLGGILSGVFGGLVGNQGGLRAAALLGFHLEARALVATATASALLVDAARVPIYVFTRGSVLVAHTPLLIAGSIGALVGTFLGVPLLSRIPKQIYRKLLATLLIVLGVTLLWAATH